MGRLLCEACFKGADSYPGVRRAGKQLAEMALKHHMSQGLPFMKGMFEKRDKQQKAAAPSADIPPAARPFPWEKGAEDE